MTSCVFTCGKAGRSMAHVLMLDYRDVLHKSGEPVAFSLCMCSADCRDGLRKIGEPIRTPFSPVFLSLFYRRRSIGTEPSCLLHMCHC